MWTVYILFSLKDHKTYTGSTNNMDRRFMEHSSGRVISTQNRRPLRLIYKENFTTEYEARNKEKYYKTCSGRKKLSTIINNIIHSEVV